VQPLPVPAAVSSPERRCVIDTAENRLRSLLLANRSIVGELSLSGVLRRIVDAAREVSGARYAALGVVGPDGLLERFVHSGVAADVPEQIGELPHGRGVLGALVTHPVPIRLSSITDDPRAVGFPPGHPRMTTFLGVPVRSHDAVFGNLYLTDRTDGQDFTDEDEELVLALAATAGIAVENARLYEDSRRRQEWLRASAEISRELVTPLSDDHDLLQRVAGSVERLADAEVVTIVVPAPDDPTMLETAATTGSGSGRVGDRHRLTGSLAEQTMGTGHGLRLDAVAADGGTELPGGKPPVGPVMVLPLTSGSRPRGAIVLSRGGERKPFTATELEMAEAFAGYAALALELTANRADQQRLTLLEDRDRIARDLHDHVIQRLFATGLSLQGAAASVAGTPLEDRLFRSVEDLDETISQVRTSIFALRETRTTSSSLRSTVLSVIDQLSPALPVRPTTRFVGPLDTLVAPLLVTDVEAVLREALTNVARHADAGVVEVVVEVVHGELAVTVLDDGVGLTPSTPHSGLANLRTRAEQRGGRLALQNRAEGGLRLRWTAPLSI